MDLYEEIEKLMQELTYSINKLRENGTKYAEAERDYKIILNQEVLKMRVDKTPATLINLIIYGVPSVAEKRFKRDVEKVNYEVNKEFINVTKLKLRVIEGQLNREWSAKD